MIELCFAFIFGLFIVIFIILPVYILQNFKNKVDTNLKDSRQSGWLSDKYNGNPCAYELALDKYETLFGCYVLYKHDKKKWLKLKALERDKENEFGVKQHD